MAKGGAACSANNCIVSRSDQVGEASQKWSHFPKQNALRNGLAASLSYSERAGSGHSPRSSVLKTGQQPALVSHWAAFSEMN